MQRGNGNNPESAKYSICFSAQQGVTLIETVVAITVSAILLSAAIPYFTNLSSGNAVQTSYDSLRNHLSNARTEAVSRRGYVSLCPKKDSTAQECFGGVFSGNLEAAEGWKNGWIIHFHRDPDHADNPVEADRIIFSQEALSDNVELKITGAPEYIRFNQYGESSPTNATVTFCVRDATNEYHAREIVISNGRIRLQEKEDTSCQ